MSYIRRAYRIVIDNPWLWLVPFALAMYSFVWSLRMGLWPIVKPGLNFKFGVPVGLPIMSQVIQERLGVGQTVGLAGGLTAVLSLAIDAYLSGGWLTAIFKLIAGETVSFDDFVRGSSRNFLPLAALRLVNILVLTVLVLPLGMLFWPLAFAALIGILALTFFWQIAVVKENLGVLSGLWRGWAVLRSNFREVLPLAALTGILSSLISAIINQLAQTKFTYPIGVVAWMVIGSVFTVAVCALYTSLTDESSSQKLDS